MSWAVVLCRFRDVPQETQSAEFFRRYFTSAGAGSGGAFDYWQDVSSGRFPNASEVFGWFEIPHDAAEITGVNRSVYQRWGFDAAKANGVPLDDFPRRIFFFNANGDHGASGAGTSVFAYAPGRPLEPTFIFHEMGHDIGLLHSYSDGAAGCCGSSTPGEYCDPWDIMSAMCVYQFPATHGTTGPGVSAPYLHRMGWLDGDRVLSTWENGSTSLDVELTSLSNPDPTGFVAVRLRHVEENADYFVELRNRSRWDRGVPHPAILVHKLDDGRSVLLNRGRTDRPNSDWKVGDTFENFFIEPFSVSVMAIDPGGQRATVRVTRRGLSPVWMRTGRIEGQSMHWSRGADIFVTADVDGDGHDEFLVANNQNGFAGVLKWNGSALVPVWVAGGRLEGAGMHWSRGTADRFLAVDVDGDGRTEFLVANDQNGFIGLLRWNGTALAPVWMVQGRIEGAGMHWSRGTDDRFMAADMDGDGFSEILVLNNQNGFVGILKWNGSALVPVWVVGGLIEGSGMHWSRGTADRFVAVDADGDGRSEFLVANNQNGFVGLLKWNGTVLAPIWMVQGRIEGAGVHWSRGADRFVAADLDGDRREEILVSNPENDWIGVLKWDGAALAAAWVQPIGSIAGDAFNGSTVFIAAGLNGSGRKSIVIPNANGWTGVFDWDGAALGRNWFAGGLLNGSAGHWRRGSNDLFLAADVDGDGREELLVAQNSNGWMGVLKWDEPP